MFKPLIPWMNPRAILFLSADVRLTGLAADPRDADHWCE